MERALRDNIGFPGTPLRLLWRGKPEKEKGIVSIGGRLGAQTAAKGPLAVGAVATAAAATKAALFPPMPVD